MIKLQQTGKTAEVKIEVLSKADRDLCDAMDEGQECIGCPTEGT